jgi:serine/threonine protein kinase
VLWVPSAAEQDKVLREGQALARVRSLYVARCLGVERQGGVPALVVEYVPGRDLRAQQKARPLGVNEALELTRQLAEGLAAVHACGLLHRDLKPDNVLVGDDGRPRLVDFGLAAAIASADLAGVSGTLPYMAPEQARGEAERIDARTDVYGLGAVLYELLAGRPPHQGRTQEELWRAACAGPSHGTCQRITDYCSRPAGSIKGRHRLAEPAVEQHAHRVCLRSFRQDKEGPKVIGFVIGFRAKNSHFQPNPIKK